MRGCAINAGASVAPFPLDPDAGWRPDLAALEAAVTPRTRLIAVTNPNNPAGTILTPAEMDAVVAAAAKVGAWILADEVYRGTERLRCWISLHSLVACGLLLHLASQAACMQHALMMRPTGLLACSMLCDVCLMFLSSGPAQRRRDTQLLGALRPRGVRWQPVQGVRPARAAHRLARRAARAAGAGVWGRHTCVLYACGVSGVLLHVGISRLDGKMMVQLSKGPALVRPDLPTEAHCMQAWRRHEYATISASILSMHLAEVALQPACISR